jgi:uncharacterized Zn-finger protein
LEFNAQGQAQCPVCTERYVRENGIVREEE